MSSPSDFCIGCINDEYPEGLLAELAAANERIRKLEGLVDKWSQDACDLSGDLCVEREVSDKLVAALEAIAKASKDEGGCYYTNRVNISMARAALAEVATIRKGEQA